MIHSYEYLVLTCILLPSRLSRRLGRQKETRKLSIKRGITERSEYMPRKFIYNLSVSTQWTTQNKKQSHFFCFVHPRHGYSVS